MYAPPVVGAVPCTPAEVLRAWSYAVRVLNVQVSLTCHLGSQTKFNEQQRYLVRTNMRSLLSGTQDAVAFPTEPRVRRLVDRFCFGFVQICCGLGGAAVLCLRHSSKRGFTSWHLYHSACCQKAQRSVQHGTQITCTCVALCASCCHHACALAYTPNACCLR